MKKSHKFLTIKLSVIALLMFAFTFALVPLYNVFCNITGLNGKVDITKSGMLARYKNENMAISQKHLIVVELDTNRHQGIPCEFTAEKPALQVTPGELTQTTYRVTNLTDKPMVIQAIPSISPGYLAKYLKKLECFCFEQQTLAPFESRDLPLRFWLETDIPEDIHRLTLSYTLFDVTLKASKNAEPKI
jgi:cytochrome c oxidase assembly protein subunit 11